MSDLRARLAQAIRRGRKAAGLDQAELAAVVGVTTETIGRWEREKMSVRVDHLPAIAAALRMGVSDLIGEGVAGEALPDTAEEARLLTLFRGLNDSDKAKAIEAAEALRMHAADPALVDVLSSFSPEARARIKRIQEALLKP